MAADDTTTDPADGKPTPDPVDGGDQAPAWVKELQTTLNELPGKLRATITDEDRTSLAESVHGLFEKSGAFQPVDTESKDETESETETETEGEDNPPAKPPGKLSTFASKFGNR